MNHDHFQARLDCCLDHRLDPLDDPELVAHLDAHPELLGAFARQRSDLRQLAAAPRAAPPRTARRAPRPLLLLGLAAAAAALAVSAQALWSAPARASARPSRILAADLHEVAPRLNAATSYTVRDPLVRTERLVLETFERRSTTR